MKLLYHVLTCEYCQSLCLERTISQLENGILILSAIKEGGACSEKLACTLGTMSKSFQSPQSINNILGLVTPRKYSDFFDQYQRAAKSPDDLVCRSKCRRCVAF